MGQTVIPALTYMPAAEMAGLVRCPDLSLASPAFGLLCRLTIPVKGALL